MWSELEILTRKFNIGVPHPIRMQMSIPFVVVQRIIIAKQTRFIQVGITVGSDCGLEQSACAARDLHAPFLQHVFEDIVFHFYRWNWMGPTGFVKFSFSEFSPEIEILRSIVCVGKKLMDVII
jgi:hypothetical protein